MKPTVIEISDLSKSYRISHQSDLAAGYNTLKDDFANLLKRPLGGKSHTTDEIFWALKDVSFEIKQGEAFGIIGKNGSGKSTLLKILSRIIEPTAGTIKMHGRVASLLEVGTGFHPELTGRENVFFNGSMLGMSRKEIMSKFHEIVEFSEIERFLDTPVKFYSSGMYVRLAFAVAAHLDPDILILDEVLAVGDAEFQKKSLEKMLNFARSGRTIIFVSHSMPAVEELCDRAILLKNGKVQMIDETSKVAEKYLGIDTKKLAEAANAAPIEITGTKKRKTIVPIDQRTDRHGDGRVVFKSLEVENHVEDKRQLILKLSLHNFTRLTFHDLKLSLDLFNEAGDYISNILNYTVGQKLELSPGTTSIKIVLDDVSLVPGTYLLNSFMARGDGAENEIFDWVENAQQFTIKPYDYYDVGKAPRYAGKAVFQKYHYEVGKPKAKESAGK